MADKFTVILSQSRGDDPKRRRLEEDLIARLAERPGLAVTVVPHLYDLAPDGPGVNFLRSVPGDMIVLGWLYPRAAYWILSGNDIKGRMGRTSSAKMDMSAAGSSDPVAPGELPDRTIWCLDLRMHDRPEPFLAEVEPIVPAVADGADVASDTVVNRVQETATSRWYPVIDFERCTNCLECLNFCLFGVFSVDESELLLIEQPDACRNGCPACSRICPAAAIMFPQHKDPSIAGDPQAAPQGLKLDLSQLFGGADVQGTAAAERDRALAEKQQETTEQPSEKGELDHLVDELDDLDI